MRLQKRKRKVPSSEQIDKVPKKKGKVAERTPFLEEEEQPSPPDQMESPQYCLMQYTEVWFKKGPSILCLYEGLQSYKRGSYKPTLKLEPYMSAR